jgi:hypothetical protein
MNVTNGKILVGSVPWDSSYRNVVVWKSDEDKDKYFNESSYFHDGGFTLENAQPLIKGQCTLPIPWEQLSTCNYLVYYPTYPIAEKQYEDNNGEKFGFDTPMYFFISNISFQAPNATACELQIDVWATYSEYVDMQSLYLERGHEACDEVRNMFNSGSITTQNSDHFKLKLEDITLNPSCITNETLIDIESVNGFNEDGITYYTDTPSLGKRLLPNEKYVALVFTKGNLNEYAGAAGLSNNIKPIVNTSFNAMSNMPPIAMSVNTFAQEWMDYAQGYYYNGSPWMENIIDVVFAPNIGLMYTDTRTININLTTSAGVVVKTINSVYYNGIYSFGCGLCKGQDDRLIIDYYGTLNIFTEQKAQYTRHPAILPSNNTYEDVKFFLPSIKHELITLPKDFTTSIKSYFAPSKCWVLSNGLGQASRFTLNDVFSDANIAKGEPITIRFDFASRYEAGNGYLKVIPRLGGQGRPVPRALKPMLNTYTDSINNMQYSYYVPSNNTDIYVNNAWSNRVNRTAPYYNYYGVGKDMALYFDNSLHVGVTADAFGLWMAGNSQKISFARDAASNNFQKASDLALNTYNNYQMNVQASDAALNISELQQRRNTSLSEQNYRYYNDINYRQGDNVMSRALGNPSSLGFLGSNLAWNQSDVSQDVQYMQNQLSNALVSQRATHNAGVAAGLGAAGANLNLSMKYSIKDYQMEIRNINNEVSANEFLPDSTFGINKGSDSVSLGEHNIRITEYDISDKNLSDSKSYWYINHLGKTGWRADMWKSFATPINLQSTRMMCNRPDSVSYWKGQDVKLIQRANKPAGLNDLYLNTIRGIIGQGVSIFDNPDNISIELPLEVLEK